MRLRRSDASRPGFHRRRRGRGFEYLDEDGEHLDDPEVLERIRGLAIPPAWEGVWICPDPRGHLQATGLDAAGRRQYRYHDAWRERRDQAKFDDMLEFARALPALRGHVARDLGAEGYGRERVLAAAIRLLDLGFFRIGSEEYAEENGSYGIATLLRCHVKVEGAAMRFDFPAKSGQRRVQSVIDPDVAPIVRALGRRRGGGDELFAYKRAGRWVDVRSHEISERLKELTGGDFSPKDFRTWSGTVIAALALAVAEGALRSESARKRAISRAVKETAYYLGNTPAVARSAYIDPRLFDRFRAGYTIAGAIEDSHDREAVEAAVLDLLGSDYRRAESVGRTRPG